MTEIKIEQKLSKQAIQELQSQQKNGVIHILKQAPADGKVSSELIVGKARRIICLHSKLVVYADILNNANVAKTDKFKVAKLSDGFAIHLV